MGGCGKAAARAVYNEVMKYYLAKSEPHDYSIDDLERDGETIWDGIHNYQAINFIKGVEIGDQVYIYSSQIGKDIVGLAEVSSAPFENTDDPRFSWAMKIKFVKKYMQKLTLAEIKAEPVCADFLLVRNPRLSFMPVTDAAQAWISQRLA